MQDENSIHFITLGHIDRDHFVFVCVHAHDSLDAGDHGYLVFYTLAAKQPCYSCLLYTSNGFGGFGNGTFHYSTGGSGFGTGDFGSFGGD